MRPQSAGICGDGWPAEQLTRRRVTIGSAVRKHGDKLSGVATIPGIEIALCYIHGAHWPPPLLDFVHPHSSAQKAPRGDSERANRSFTTLEDQWRRQSAHEFRLQARPCCTATRHNAG